MQNKVKNLNLLDFKLKRNAITYIFIVFTIFVSIIAISMLIHVKFLNIGMFGVLIVISIYPLVFNTNHRFYLSFTKCEISILFSLFLSFIWLIGSTSVAIPLNILTYIYFLLILVEVFNVFFVSEKPFLSYSGSFSRCMGFIYRLSVYTMVLYTVAFVYVYKDGYMKLLMYSLVLSGFLSSLIIILEYVHKNFFKISDLFNLSKHSDRFQGFFANPLYASAYLSTLLPISLYLVINENSPFHKISLITILIGVVLTSSMTEVVSVFISLLVSITFLIFGKDVDFFSWYIVLLLPIPFFLLRKRYVKNKLKRFKANENSAKDSTKESITSRYIRIPEGRLVIWKNWLYIVNRMNLRQKLFGIGIENIADISTKYRLLITYGVYGEDAIDRFHNHIMDVFIEGGVLYTVSWIALIFVSLMTSYNTFYFIFVALLNLYIHLMFSFFDHTTFMLFNMLIGLLFINHGEKILYFGKMPMIVLFFLSLINLFVIAGFSFSQFLSKMRLNILNEVPGTIRLHIWNMNRIYSYLFSDFWISNLDLIDNITFTFPNISGLISDLITDEKVVIKSSKPVHIVKLYNTLSQMLLSLYETNSQNKKAKHLAFNFIKKSLQVDKYNISTILLLVRYMFLSNKPDLAIKIGIRHYYRLLLGNRMNILESFLKDFQNLLAKYVGSNAYEEYIYKMWNDAYEKFPGLYFKNVVLQGISSATGITINVRQRLNKHSFKELYRVLPTQDRSSKKIEEEYLVCIINNVLYITSNICLNEIQRRVFEKYLSHYVQWLKNKRNDAKFDFEIYTKCEKFKE